MAKPGKKSEVNPERNFVTPEFRVSYPHLFKPNAIKPNDAPKYSVTMLFKKTTDLSVLKLALKHAKIDAYGPDPKQWPKDLLSPVSDGDDEKYADKEGYAGHWAVKASSNADNKPGLVDENVEPIIDQGAFYPGCYARAQVFAHSWEYMGKKGVSFILDNVQKTKDGKSFGGKKSAKDVFNPVANVGNDDEDSEIEAEDNNDDFT